MKKFKIIYLLLVLLSSSSINAQVLDSAILDLSTDPPQLKTFISSALLDITDIEHVDMMDAENTHVVTIKLKGLMSNMCGSYNVWSSQPANVEIPTTIPFKVTLYVVYDTSAECGFPIKPLYSNPYYLSSDNPTSIETVDLSKSFNIYPNPVSKFLYIEVNNEIEIEQIILLDILGRTMKSFESNNSKLDISDLSKGIYLLKINTEKGTYNKQIVIK